MTGSVGLVGLVGLGLGLGLELDLLLNKWLREYSVLTEILPMYVTSNVCVYHGPRLRLNLNFIFYFILFYVSILFFSF